MYLFGFIFKGVQSGYVYLNKYSMEYQINEKLIQAVRPRQILYDKNYDNYKNNNVRRKIWKDIGDEIGIPCKY